MKITEAAKIAFKQTALLRQSEATACAYERAIRFFAVYMRDMDVTLVTVLDVERYIKESEEAGFSRATTITRLAALRSFFRRLKRFGYSVLDPDDLPVPRKEFKGAVKSASDSDLEALEKAMRKCKQKYAKSRNLSMLYLLRDTGIRVGELSGLDIDRINTDTMRGYVHTEKSRGGSRTSGAPIRLIAWYEDCNKFLKEWLVCRREILRFTNEKEKALFLNVGSRKNTLRGKRLQTESISEVFRRYSVIAGLPYNINPHKLRHRKGRLLSLNGANNSIISQILGHVSINSSLTYTQLEDHQLDWMARTYGDETIKSTPRVHTRRKGREESKTVGNAKGKPKRVQFRQAV